MATMNARSARSVRPRPQDLNEGRGRLLLQDPQDLRPAQATSRKAAECHSCSSCPEDFSRYRVAPCSSMPFESASAILNVSPAPVFPCEDFRVFATHFPAGLADPRTGSHARLTRFMFSR